MSENLRENPKIFTESGLNLAMAPT